MKNLIRVSKAMGTVPFVNRNVLGVVNKKWQTLPSGQTRNINEGYSQVKGTTKDEPWDTKFYGGDIKIDVQVENLANAIESETSLQTNMFITGMAADWTYDFIANDPTINPKGMNGLKYLVSNFQNSRQQIFLDSNSNNTGTALDVTANSASKQKFINALHKGLKYVGADRGGKICIYNNENLYLGVSAVLRSSGLLDTTKDEFDREFSTFAGHPLIDVGLKSDQTTEIIPLNEGTGAASTSLYIVRWDKSDGAIGVQKGTMRIYDPLGGREMEAQPAHLLRCDWGTMIVPRSDFCIVRIGGIKNPASWTEPV